MLVILDTCGLGIGPSPDGGVTLKISEIEGLPHISFGIPVSAEASAALMEQMTKILNKPKPKAFDLAAMREEAANAASRTSEPTP